MSDKARTEINTAVLLDNIKTNLSGGYDFDILTKIAASSGSGWIYEERQVVITASTDLITTAMDYIPKEGIDETVAAGDKIQWIAIKHTGTIDGTIPTNNGVMLCTDAGTAAYDVADGIYLGPNELITLKCPNTVQTDLHARSVAENGYGLPNAAGTTSVMVRIAAILENVG